MTAFIAITIAPEAMNTARDCQKVKLTPKAKNSTMNAGHEECNNSACDPCPKVDSWTLFCSRVRVKRQRFDFSNSESKS